MTMQEHMLFIGFGDIAARISEQATSHYTMSGFKRNTINNPLVDIILGDCGSEADLQRLFNNIHYDVIVITLTPSVINDAGYRKAYLDTSDALLKALEQQEQKPRLIIFVSSTSVYGQKNAQWVDERSPTEPTSFSGKILLEAEQRWQQSQYNTCIVRPSGIYGPGRRRLIEQVKTGQGTAAEPILYSNRIHADDVAAAIYHLIQISQTNIIESLYLLSDSEPTPLHEVKAWLAQAMHLPKHHLQETQTAGRGFRGSKRCCNDRLRGTGFTLKYDNFREGYQSLLD